MKKKTPLIIMGAVGLSLSFAAGITFTHKAAVQPQIAHALADHCDHDIALNNDFFSPAAAHGWTSNAYDLPEGSYYFEEDVVISNDYTLNILDGVTVSICLNGKSVKNTSSSSSPLFDVKGGGKLNIFDCGTDEHKYSIQEEGSGYEIFTRAIVDDTLTADFKTFTGGYFTHFTKAIVKVEESTKSGDGLVWAGGSILAGKNNGQLDIHGNLSITKGNFIGNDTGHNVSAENSSAVFVGNKGKATLGENVLFTENRGGSNGTCVYGVVGSKLTISSKFIDNASSYAAVYSFDEISLSKAVFKNNKSIAYPFSNSGTGSAVVINRNDETVTTKSASIDQCTFENNTSISQMGGAVMFITSRESNKTSGTNVLNVSNCTFDHNFSETGAGAIYFLDSSSSNSCLNIDYSTFTNNSGNSGSEYTYSIGGAVFYDICTNSDPDDSTKLLPSNGNLNISESTFTNNSAVFGGALGISCGVTSTMKALIYDSTMSENEAISDISDKGLGGAIYASTEANPEDILISFQEKAKINNNTAKVSGGGVYAKNAIIEVNDYTTIKDNKVGEADNNVWLVKYKEGNFNTSKRGAFINVKYKLRGDASIGVSMEEPGDFTTLLGTTNNGLASEALEHFFSDDENYEVKINSENDQLMLSGGTPAHVHNWTYSASGATITATCSVSDCTDSPITITLIAPSNLVYDGSAKEVNLESNKSWSGILPAGTMKYYQGDKEVAACIEVGVYTAKYTMGGETAVLEFAITGPTVVDPDNDDVTVEINDDVDLTNVELRVEVRADVKEKDIPEQYNIILNQLGENEEIAKVYDVRLIRKVGDVETEIQPSDLKPGLKLKVHMAIPEGLDVANMRILHIHSLEDMEFINNPVQVGNDLVFEISKLSQFAFIKKVNAPAPQPAKAGLPTGAIVGIVLGSILLACLIAFLLLFFVFAKFIIVKEKEEEKVVRAIKIGKDKKDNKDYFWMMTFKFKRELKPEEEVFDKKQDAEDFLNKNKGQQE